MTFPKGTRLWTPPEGTRCFGNQSPFILDPRLSGIINLKKINIILLLQRRGLPKRVTFYLEKVFGRE